MFESSVGKDTKEKGYNKGGGSRVGDGTFMSDTKCQRIEN